MVNCTEVLIILYKADVTINLYTMYVHLILVLCYQLVFMYNSNKGDVIKWGDYMYICTDACTPL